MTRAFVLTLLVLGASASALTGQLVVVVHRDVPVDAVTMDELRDIYAGRAGYWADESGRVPIVLVDHEDEDAAGDFSRRVLGLSRARLRLLWMDRILNGEMRRLPVTLGGDAEVVAYVAENVGAIGFVRSGGFDPADQRIKALRVDGRAVGEPGYPLG